MTTQPLQPFRFENRYTLAAATLPDATKSWEELDEAAEELGFHGEGGAMGLMPLEDVIPDSPLAKEIDLGCTCDFVGWHLIHQAHLDYAEVEVCYAPEPFLHRYGRVVVIGDNDFVLAGASFRNRLDWVDVAGAWLLSETPEPCPICAGAPNPQPSEKSVV